MFPQVGRGRKPLWSWDDHCSSFSPGKTIVPAFTKEDDETQKDYTLPVPQTQFANFS